MIFRRLSRWLSVLIWRYVWRWLRGEVDVRESGRRDKCELPFCKVSKCEGVWMTIDSKRCHSRCIQRNWVGDAVSPWLLSWGQGSVLVFGGKGESGCCGGYISRVVLIHPTCEGRHDNYKHHAWTRTKFFNTRSELKLHFHLCRSLPACAIDWRHVIWLRILPGYRLQLSGRYRRVKDWGRQWMHCLKHQDHHSSQRSLFYTSNYSKYILVLQNWL